MADEEFVLIIHMLAALAFVPLNDPINSFDTPAYYSRNGYGQDLDDMLDYLRTTILVGLDIMHQEDAQSSTWNMFHRIDNELPRTNNAVEGWHRGFQLHVMTYHLSFWKFIDIMKQEEGLF